MKSEFNYEPYWLILLYISFATPLFYMGYKSTFEDFSSPGTFFFFSTLFSGGFIYAILDFRLEWHKLEFDNDYILVSPFLGKAYHIRFNEILESKEELKSSKNQKWTELSIYSDKRYLVISSKVYSNYEAIKKIIEEKQPVLSGNRPFLQAKYKFYNTFCQLILPIVAAWVCLGVYLHQHDWNQYTRNDLFVIRDVLSENPQEFKKKKHYHIEFSLRSKPHSIFRLNNNINNFAKAVKGGDSIEISILKKYQNAFSQQFSGQNLRPLEIKHYSIQKGKYTISDNSNSPPPPLPLNPVNADNSFVRDTFITKETIFIDFDQEIDEEMHSHKDSIAFALFLGISIFLGFILNYRYKSMRIV